MEADLLGRSIIPCTMRGPRDRLGLVLSVAAWVGLALRAAFGD